VKGSGRGLIWSTISAFIWSWKLNKPQKVLLRIAGLWVEFWAWGKAGTLFTCNILPSKLVRRTGIHFYRIHFVMCSVHSIKWTHLNVAVYVYICPYVSSPKLFNGSWWNFVLDGRICRGLALVHRPPSEDLLSCRRHLVPRMYKALRTWETSKVATKTVPNDGLRISVSRQACSSQCLRLFNPSKSIPRLAYKRDNIARFYSCVHNINPRNVAGIQTALLADFRSLLYWPKSSATRHFILQKMVSVLRPRMLLEELRLSWP
jgi:hypothetical protein